MTRGQAGDNPQLVPLLDDHAAACQRAGVAGLDFRLLADKAYSHPSTRTESRSRRIKHTIPERKDQIKRLKDKGSAGGRPPSFDPVAYAQRNTVERGFNLLEQWRAVATRYDKYALTYLLACTISHLRRKPHKFSDTAAADDGLRRLRAATGGREAWLDIGRRMHRERKWRARLGGGAAWQSILDAGPGFFGFQAVGEFQQGAFVAVGRPQL